MSGSGTLLWALSVLLLPVVGMLWYFAVGQKTSRRRTAASVTDALRPFFWLRVHGAHLCSLGLPQHPSRLHIQAQRHLVRNGGETRRITQPLRTLRRIARPATPCCAAGATLGARGYGYGP